MDIGPRHAVRNAESSRPLEQDGRVVLRPGVHGDQLIREMHERRGRARRGALRAHRGAHAFQHHGRQRPDFADRAADLRQGDAEDGASRFVLCRPALDERFDIREIVGEVVHREHPSEMEQHAGKKSFFGRLGAQACAQMSREQPGQEGGDGFLAQPAAFRPAREVTETRQPVACETDLVHAQQADGIADGLDASGAARVVRRVRELQQAARQGHVAQHHVGEPADRRGLHVPRDGIDIGERAGDGGKVALAFDAFQHERDGAVYGSGLAVRLGAMRLQDGQQRRVHVTCRIESLGRIACGRASVHLGQGARRLERVERRDVRLLLEDPLGHVFARALGDGAFSGHALEQDLSEGEHVGPAVQRFREELLRCHVRHGPGDQPG